MMYHMKLYLKNSGSNQRKTQTAPDDCCLFLNLAIVKSNDQIFPHMYVNCVTRMWHRPCAKIYVRTCILKKA